MNKHREYQNEHYSNYNSFDSTKYYLFKIVRMLKNNNIKFKNVLDVGCADGSFLAFLKGKFHIQAKGIDISEKAIEKAKKKGLDARIADVEEGLPFKNNSFDLVISSEVIEHVYDTDYFLKELNRVLKPNGTLVLTTPNLASLINRVRLLFGMYPLFVPEYKKEQAGHLRAYTIKVLRQQLEENNFRPFIITAPNFPFPINNNRIPRFIKNIFIYLGDFFPTFGGIIIIFSRVKKTTQTNMKSKN